MQPTYLPWIGYFALMDRVDSFVILDSVQFARRSWQQRNKINSHCGPKMLTVPVKSKGMRDQLICNVAINDSGSALQSHINIIQNEYVTSKYFSDYSSGIFDIMNRGHDKLVDLNIDLIMFFKNVLNIDTRVFRSCELDSDGSKDELLAGLCEKLEANTYISPPGSRVYMEESDAFAKRNIKVEYNEYEHPTYKQVHGKFEPYMSIIDLLFNVGPQSREVMLLGIK